MDNIPIFVPNFPPPPIRPDLMRISKPKTNINLYKERLENYLSSRKDRLPFHSTNEMRQMPLKLSEMTRELSHFYDSVETIKADIQNLSECAPSIDSNQWDIRITELKSQLNELSSTSQKYQENRNLCQAKRAVEIRLKRRNRIKKRKAEVNALKKCEMKNRELKHQQIDEWLRRNADEIRERRRDDEQKQRAERVLAEVKSCKSDAAKYLSLFDALKELYRIRCRDKATNAMGNIEFNAEMEKLNETWSNALDKYGMEEKRLRTFLDQDSNHWDEWQEIMFGNVKTEDIFSLKKNENGLEKLIAIRSQWDRFVVSHGNAYGSNLPLGWVIPNANPSIQWKTYLKDKIN